MDKTWYNIFKEAKEKLKLRDMHLDDIQDIFASQFKFLRSTYEKIDIHKETFPTIFIPEIGRFYGKRKTIKQYKRRKLEEQLNKEINGKQD